MKSSREKKLAARRKRRESACRYCCVRLAIVALGSFFSVFLLVLSNIESVEHESQIFAVSHAAAGAARGRAERKGETWRTHGA